jgi:hypothetical protein
MATVIHTRKGKYQYAYEHTREGDKVVSRYMYPVDAKGDLTEPYQREIVEYTEVAQHREIIIGKPITYTGTKEIEVEYDPFINGDFKPVSTRYVIKKYKEEKKWYVYKEGRYTRYLYRYRYFKKL